MVLIKLSEGLQKEAKFTCHLFPQTNDFKRLRLTASRSSNGNVWNALKEQNTEGR